MLTILAMLTMLTMLAMLKILAILIFIDCRDAPRRLSSNNVEEALFDELSQVRLGKAGALSEL